MALRGLALSSISLKLELDDFTGESAEVVYLTQKLNLYKISNLEYLAIYMEQHKRCLDGIVAPRNPIFSRNFGRGGGSYLHKFVFLLYSL